MLRRTPYARRAYDYEYQLTEWVQHIRVYSGKLPNKIIRSSNALSGRGMRQSVGCHNGEHDQHINQKGQQQVVEALQEEQTYPTFLPIAG